jgi:cysteinyl-tRNA synthetase
MSMARDHVTYVRNITDVDDKINARALRDYPDLPLNEAIAKVTEKTADRFHKDAARSAALNRRTSRAPPPISMAWSK